MKLKSIEYSENIGSQEWHLKDCVFNDINLIAGKNATGKTRILNLINALSLLLSGERITAGNFSVIFDDAGKEISYQLNVNLNGKVEKESLKQDNKILLERGADGAGKIFAEKLNIYIEIKPPQTEIGVVSRRDAIQHPFFENLYQWGKSVRYFQFGTSMGRDQLAIFTSDAENRELNLKDFHQVVAIFRRGKLDYGEQYIQQILEDMQKVGYELETIDIGIDKVFFNGKLTTANGIYVKEKDLEAQTSQTQISSGMFRTLSLFVQLNYAILASPLSCILIDDIGEGLDYTRSTALIDRLINKVEGTNIQLIMSTNDQFVMDAVPLNYWLVTKRSPNSTEVYNYHNSKERFDSFKFTGLSNFDFFSSNYYLKETSDS